MAKTKMKDTSRLLDWVLCIHYPLYFRKNKKDGIRAPINSGSKVNVKMLTYASKLGLKICSTDFRDQKIDSSTIETFKIVLASFQVENKLEKI